MSAVKTQGWVIILVLSALLSVSFSLLVREMFLLEKGSFAVLVASENIFAFLVGVGLFILAITSMATKNDPLWVRKLSQCFKPESVE